MFKLKQSTNFPLGWYWVGVWGRHGIYIYSDYEWRAKRAVTTTFWSPRGAQTPGGGAETHDVKIFRKK